MGAFNTSRLGARHVGITRWTFSILETFRPSTILMVVATALLVFSVSSLRAEEVSSQVTVLSIHGNIDPVVTRYVEQGVRAANQRHDRLIVIELSSQAGLVRDTSTLVQTLSRSTVPVAVYISPSGARISSAGLLVAMSAGVVAAAPGTSFGLRNRPARSSSGQRQGAGSQSDAAELVRSLATAHGRNGKLAAEVLDGSATIGETEALSGRLVDFSAPDLTALLAKLNGVSVRADGKDVTLQTAGAPIRFYGESFWGQILSALLKPNTAYVLFILGIIGILVELSIPGIGLPGIAGAICLLLSFPAFGLFSVNVVGIGVILLGVALFIIDIKAPTHGALSAGGVIALLIGSFLLFPDTMRPQASGIVSPHVSPLTIVLMTAVLSAFLVFVVVKGFVAQKRKITTGPSALVGLDGVAVTTLQPNGTIRVANEEWSAESLDEGIAEGETVTVVASEGIHLVVVRKGW